MHLTFAKFHADSFKEYYRLVSDIRVMVQITERALTQEEARDRFDRILKRNEAHRAFGSYMVLEKDSFVGLGHITLKEGQEREAEIGYMLLPDYWGKGYGTLIAREMVRLGVEGGLHKLTAIIDPENIPSRKILIRLGFVSEGLRDYDGLPGELLSLKLKEAKVL